MGRLISAPANAPDDKHEQQRPPAEQRADEREQLGVAQAEPLALEDVAIEVCDEPEEQVAGGGADQPVQPGHVMGREAGGEEERDRRQRDHVGQPKRREIDERQHDAARPRTRSRPRSGPADRAASPGIARDEASARAPARAAPPALRPAGSGPRTVACRPGSGRAAGRYERSGMLSAARIGVPQLAQRDRGRTIDSPAGTRAMQTLKKLPQTAPNSRRHRRHRRRGETAEAISSIAVMLRLAPR